MPDSFEGQVVCIVSVLFFSCPVCDLFIRANRLCGDLPWCCQGMYCVLFSPRLIKKAIPIELDKADRTIT